MTIETGYECLVPGQLCTLLCGNGRMDSGEVCDDGNRVSGDGCSSSCTVEAHYKCPAPGPWYFNYEILLAGLHVEII